MSHETWDFPGVPFTQIDPHKVSAYLDAITKPTIRPAAFRHRNLISSMWTQLTQLTRDCYVSLLLMYNKECNGQAVWKCHPGKQGSRVRSYTTGMCHDNWLPSDNSISLSSGFLNRPNRWFSLQVKSCSCKFSFFIPLFPNVLLLKYKSIPYQC